MVTVGAARIAAPGPGISRSGSSMTAGLLEGLPHDADREPRFADYLYPSSTNATAFSPTDVMPLSRWAKMLMLVQALVSLVTIALVVSRAVNVLGG